MSAHRTLRRTAATFAVATAAVLAALVPATAANADDGDVRVSLSSISSNSTAGSTRDNFSTRLENRTKDPIDDVRIGFVVHLDGLSPDAVHITRGLELTKTTNGSDVIFADPLGLRLPPSRSASRSYQIRFDAGAPSGEARLTAIAFLGNDQLGSASATIRVRSANGPATPTTTPSPTPAATVPGLTIPGGPTSSIAPLGADSGRTTLADDGSGGVSTIVYVLGGFLMLIGATILWLLFRSPRPPATDEPVAAGPIDQTGPPSLGYPAGPRASAPTAMMPVVSDQRTATLQQPRQTQAWEQPRPRPLRDPRPTAAHPRIPGGGRPMGTGSTTIGPMPGQGNPGSPDTGSTNVGSTNVGSTNVGSTNVGSTNTGSTNTGPTMPGVDPWADTAGFDDTPPGRGAHRPRPPRH